MDRSDATSPAFARFLSSMSLNVERWREGDPYDLSALDELSSHERTQVLHLLTERLAGSAGDWRDVDALVALGTPAADALLVECTRNADAAVRLRAGKRLAEQGRPAPLEQELLGILRDPDADAPIEMTMRLAREHTTPEVKSALLLCAVEGAPDLRVHAAALSLFLAGRAREPFDWAHRPLFLRFGEDERALRLAAMDDLLLLMRGNPSPAHDEVKR